MVQIPLCHLPALGSQVTCYLIFLLIFIILVFIHWPHKYRTKLIDHNVTDDLLCTRHSARDAEMNKTEGFCPYEGGIFIGEEKWTMSILSINISKASQMILMRVTNHRPMSEPDSHPTDDHWASAMCQGSSRFGVPTRKVRKKEIKKD